MQYEYVQYNGSAAVVLFTITDGKLTGYCMYRQSLSVTHTPSHCRLDREAPCRERQTFRSTYSGGGEGGEGGGRGEGWDSGEDGECQDEGEEARKCSFGSISG